MRIFWGRNNDITNSLVNTKNCHQMLYMVGFHGLISDILNKGRLKDHLLGFSRQINIAKWSEHIILVTKNHTLGHKSNTNHSSYLNLHSIISNLWKFTQPKGTSNNQQLKQKKGTAVWNRRAASAELNQLTEPKTEYKKLSKIITII